VQVTKQKSSFEFGKKVYFLPFQLSTEFDFDHPTPKSDILNHQTIKTVYI